MVPRKTYVFSSLGLIYYNLYEYGQPTIFFSHKTWAVASVCGIASPGTSLFCYRLHVPIWVMGEKFGSVNRSRNNLNRSRNNLNQSQNVLQPVATGHFAQCMKKWHVVTGLPVIINRSTGYAFLGILSFIQTDSQLRPQLEESSPSLALWVM